MNRRDLLKSVAGMAVAGGVATASASVVAADPVPVCAVLEFNGPISNECACRLRETFESAFKDTPFEQVKVVVLGDGLRLTFLDRHGRICNQRIDALESEA